MKPSAGNHSADKYSAIVSINGDCLYLRGILDFSNVALLQAQGDDWLNNLASLQCRLDLSAVEYSNSAGTALLLAWLRTARATGKQLQIQHIPDNLAAIIHLGGLDQELKQSSAIEIGK